MEYDPIMVDFAAVVINFLKVFFVGLTVLSKVF